MSTQTGAKIHKDMTIADIIDTVPESVEVMQAAGLHCVGCSANLYETLEEGMMGHGFPAEAVDALVEEINIHAAKAQPEKREPTPEDAVLQKIEKDGETLYKIAGMSFTDKAVNALKELSGDKTALQLRVEAGGCSGYSYRYDFADKPADDEKVYDLSDDMQIFMNDFSFDKLHGSEIDFESGLHGSGLVFRNPNAKSGCGCGSSVGF